MSQAVGQITNLLRAVQQNCPNAQNELIALIYSELRAIAYRRRGTCRDPNLLTPTALVHEAYMRLFDRGCLEWENSRHFFWAASRAMKDILVEEARRVTALKRGGHFQRVELIEDMLLEEEAELMIETSEAMDALATVNPELAEIVTVHFFCGLTHKECAELLQLSAATVRRRWEIARDWLREKACVELQGQF